LGRLFPITDATSVTPSVRADYARVTTDSYTETGAGALNLTVPDATYDEMLLTLDAKAAHNLNASWQLFGNVAVGYDFLNDQAQATSSFAGGGPTFVTNGLEPSPWIMRAGAGLMKQTATGYDFSLRYDAEGRTSGFLNQMVSARVRKSF
jgi:outer membrane autotransporter protein